MVKFRKHAGILGAVLALTLVAAACGGDDDTSGDTSGDGGDTTEMLSGTIRIDGSSTVGPLSEGAAELFMAENPDVRVTVAISGTSGGFEKFCIGENDMNDASRPIKDTEIELCGENDIGYDAIQVANDALSMVVNAENPVECITKDQATQIWNEGSDVQTWGDIDGLDVPADVAGQKLTLYGAGTDSGTFDFFTEAINGEEGVIRTDYTSIGENDLAGVQAVEGDVYAMTYVPYSYYQEAGDQVKALAIDDGHGCVDATIENVQDASYTPLGRPLFVYASDSALQKPEVLAFMKFYIDNAIQIAEATGFVPLTQAQIDEQHVKIEALAGA
jgi:phosphate transport system substrate-binding protein